MMPNSSNALPLSSQDAQRAARNVSVLMLASIVSKGALYLWQIALSVLLGPTEYGIYGTVGGMMVTAASLASFGMGLIVIRDVARAPQLAGKYWSAMLFAQTVFALCAYVGMNGFATVYSETLRAFVALAGINLFVDIFGNMAQDLLLAQERMLATSLVEVAHIALRIALAWAALVTGWGLLGVYGAAIASGLLRSLLLTGLNLRAGIYPAFPLDRAVAHPLLRNSAPIALSAFLTLAYNHSDKLLTTGILNETLTGYLTAAFVINFGIIELFSTTVLVAAYPLLARVYEDGRSSTFGWMIEKLSLYMLLVGLPMALCIGILADKIMLPLLGQAYAPAADILRLLILYTAITIFGNVFSKGLLVQNRQRRLLAIRAASLSLNIMLSAILLTRWGDPRAAVAASIVGELLAVFLLLGSFRAQGWNLRRLASPFTRLLLLALPTGLLLLLLREQFIALPLLAALGLYGAGIFALRVLRPEDWDLLYQLASSLPGGRRLQRIWRRDALTSW